MLSLLTNYLVAQQANSLSLQVKKPLILRMCYSGESLSLYLSIVTMMYKAALRSNQLGSLKWRNTCGTRLFIISVYGGKKPLRCLTKKSFYNIRNLYFINDLIKEGSCSESRGLVCALIVVYLISCKLLCKYCK